MERKMDADLNDKTKNFQSGYLDLQNKMQKGLVTRADADQNNADIFDAGVRQ